MKRRHNILLWAGFVVVLLAVGTYIPIFAVYAATRDVPWVNYLLFAAGGVLLVLGLRRAFGQPELYRGKVLGSILAGLSVLLLALFCFVIFYISKAIPASETAVRVGQSAPDFTLTSADGKQISLSDQLKNNRAVVLIFYRGYW
jgi:preprotein translocase subunit SecY